MSDEKYFIYKIKFYHILHLLKNKQIFMNVQFECIFNKYVLQLLYACFCRISMTVEGTMHERDHPPTRGNVKYFFFNLLGFCFKVIKYSTMSLKKSLF